MSPDIPGVASARCGCAACNVNAWWMVVCDVCGNKRCPHATDHRHTCTGSNASGQVGSVFYHIGVDLGSEPDTAVVFQNEYMGLTWLDEEAADRRKREEEYQQRTESYDRTVCTGPVCNGVIWPANEVERSLITRHAIMVRRQLGLDRKPEVVKFVQRGWRSFQCTECSHTWRWASRDAKSPSGENCPNCDEWCTPYNHVIDPSIPCDSSGNLTVRHDWMGNSDT